MNKTAKVLLIVGGILAVAFVVIMSIYGWNFSALSSVSEYDIMYETVENTDQNIEIWESDVDIIVRTSEDENIHFTYYENENASYEKDLGGDIMFKKKSNVNIINFASAPHFEVLLPEGYNGNLVFNTANDDIDIMGVSFANGEIQTTNGDITITNADSSGDSIVNTQNGDIDVNSSDFGKITLSNANGDVRTDTVTASDGIEAMTQNSDITATNQSSQTLSMHVVSGDVKFDSIFASEIEASAVNGDVKGSIDATQSDFSYSSTTKNGDNNLGDSINPSAPNVLNVTSENGDVQITFAE